MIYHKVYLEKLNKTINIDVYGDDLFTKCPDCGIEQQLDDDMLRSVEDFGGTSFYCTDCTKKYLNRE